MPCLLPRFYKGAKVNLMVEVPGCGSVYLPAGYDQVSREWGHLCQPGDLYWSFAYHDWVYVVPNNNGVYPSEDEYDMLLRVKMVKNQVTIE